jgi:hypothetical protein
MEFRQIKREPAKLPFTTECQRPCLPVISARISEHMAVAVVLVTFAGRNIMLVAAVTHDDPPDPAEDRPMRHHQQHDERQPPIREVDGK